MPEALADPRRLHAGAPALKADKKSSPSELPQGREQARTLLE